jgi:putative peptidoglycan lipid II flippase
VFRRVLGATVAVGVATALVRLFGLVKNQAIAASFGVGLDVECFLLASILPTFAYGVLANSLPSALLPALAGVRLRSGPEAARRLGAELLGWSLLVWLAAGLVVGLAWPAYLALVGGGFAPQKAALCTRLFYLLLPSLVLHGTSALWSALLNAEKRFLGPVLVLGVIPLSVAASALWLGPELGAYALAGGYLAGVVVELLLVALCAARAGVALVPLRPARSPEAALVLGQYLPVLGGGLLMRSTTLVDQSMAAALPAGNLAALSYADVVVSAVLAVGASALGTAILPYLSDMAAAREFGAMRRSLRTWTALVLAVSIPATAAAVLLARPLIGVLFERGQFRAEHTAEVGWIFALYVLQVPCYAVGILCARVLSALARNQLLLAIASVNLVADVLLNLAFIPWLGAAGIALSTALVYLLSMLLLWLAVTRCLASPAAAGGGQPG